MVRAYWLIDFYKAGHYLQYPKGTKQVWVNWTPRSSRVPGGTHMVHFGLQYFIKEYLTRRFNEGFFYVPLAEVLRDYREVMATCLHVENPVTEHIERLHKLGYLPIEIYSIPEGFSTGMNVPSMVITNTREEEFWLPNYLETMLSMTLWKPSTSATAAQRFRKICEKWADKWFENIPKHNGGWAPGLEEYNNRYAHVEWQCHDFSMRGMSGLEDAVLSGMGHLLSFSGTDTVPAIMAAREFYGANLNTGGSVPATEHSVMCAGGAENEVETFRRLIEDVYPSGIVSIVSDTWNLWDVLTKIVPALKDKILARNGKVVIRPDSGDPVKIICGDHDDNGIWELLNENEQMPYHKGVLRLLAETLGVTNGCINGAATIYGDSINLDRCEQILQRTTEEIELSPANVVFGVGSYTYEYCTRDTWGLAMKATAVRDASGKVIDIFKSPVTDDPKNPKKSLKGIPCVYRIIESTEEKPDYFVTDGHKPEDLDNCAFQKVYRNGELLIETSFDEIRKRVRA